MLSSAHMTPRLLTLWGERFGSVPLYCASETAVGIDEVDDLRDFTLRETTKDQQRIETYLRTQCGHKTAAFHVGIGNSCFAQTFSSSIAMVVGITIQENEIEHAKDLRISNYYPMLMNKYSIEYANAFPSSFDFILDNNPSTFSCCFFHFARMMTTYRALLTDSGQIVTDRVGLGWVVTGGNPRWRFDFTDWARIAEALGLAAEDVDGNVYTMRQCL